MPRVELSVASTSALPGILRLEGEEYARSLWCVPQHDKMRFESGSSTSLRMDHKDPSVGPASHVAPSKPVLSKGEPYFCSSSSSSSFSSKLPLASVPMGSAAALTTVIAVGPGRGRRQLPPTRHGVRGCREISPLSATAGYYQRAGSLGRRGKQPYLSAPCFRKGRGENEVIDELLREGAVEGGGHEEKGDGGGGEEDELLLVEEKGTLDGKWRFPWEGLPQRYKLIGTTSLAFVICNMDKVNLSVAIIPMSHQFGWNSSTAGLIQSSFFWGYAISQLPGGWLAKFFGGRKVLEVGVLCWSLATMLVPLVAGFMPGLLLSRVLVGIGEGVSPSSATDLIARTIPLQERSRAVGIVFGGLSIGSVLGLLFAPPIIQNLGWESVFYIFGLVGLLWCGGFELVKGQSAVDEAFASSPRGRPNYTVATPSLTSDELRTQNASIKELGDSLQDVPWKAFFRSPAVWAMIYAHFCGSWGHYTCLSWLPTFFSEELNLNLTEAAWVTILPSLGSILITSIAATFADNLISRGVETTTVIAVHDDTSFMKVKKIVVRKICQSIAFISPAVCMTLSSLDLGLPHWEVVAFLTGGLALSSFALSGLYCTHQDISPEYASVLLGITNTVGAVPGIVGVSLTGILLDSTHSWSLALFAPSIFFYLTGTVVWLTFASSKPQSFSKG